MFLKQIPYQKYDWQMISSALWVVLAFFWWCLLKHASFLILMESSVSTFLSCCLCAWRPISDPSEHTQRTRGLTVSH